MYLLLQNLLFQQNVVRVRHSLSAVECWTTSQTLSQLLHVYQSRGTSNTTPGNRSTGHGGSPTTTRTA